DNTFQEMSKIEKSVFDLSDAAIIESDPELSAARAAVLQKLEQIGTQVREKSNDSVRRQIASLEDKGRSLQEELISSMESEAYTVRKSVESSLSKVKQTIKEAETAIQTLQNRYVQ